MLIRVHSWRRSGAWAAWLSLLLATAAAGAQAQGYTYTTLHVEGGLSTQVSGINAAGLIVGSYQMPRGNSVLLRPFVYENGVYRPVPSGEPAAHTFDDVNAARHVVTNKLHRDLTSEAALVAGTKRTVIAVPSAVSTAARGLNDLDDVVGSFEHERDELGILKTTGFLWRRDGSVTTFDAPAADGRLTMPWGINNAGIVVGVYMDAAQVYHGFVRGADGRFTTVDVPGSPYTQLMAVNGNGDVVGFFQDPVDFVLKGFVLRAGTGTFEAVTPPGAEFGAYPTRITDDGRIVGWYIDAQGLVRSFVAAPAR